MNKNEIENILTFLKSAENLKNTTRTAWTTNGRQESTAEHTWRLCLMVMLFEKQYPDLDTLKLIKMCIIHDLGEAIGGDIAAVDQLNTDCKNINERKDLETLLEPLSTDLTQQILSLWDEYEKGSSKEAKIAKAFDKLETILQHNQGQNPEDFNYGFNLTYGQQYTTLDSTTAAIKDLLDTETSKLVQKSSNIV